MQILGEEVRQIIPNKWSQNKLWFIHPDYAPNDITLLHPVEREQEADLVTATPGILLTHLIPQENLQKQRKMRKINDEQGL